MDKGSKEKMQETSKCGIKYELEKKREEIGKERPKERKRTTQRNTHENQTAADLLVLTGLLVGATPSI